MIKAIEPTTTVLNERSFSVRDTCCLSLPFFRELTLSLNEAIMVGIVFIKVIKPPAATAPAPICLT